MPLALELIAKYVTGTSRQYCNDLFGVCDVQTDVDYEDATEVAITESEDIPKDCSSCKNSVNKVLTELRTESILNTITNFTENLCPTIEEITQRDCEDKVVNWWPIIAQIIYSEEAAVLVCEELDPECQHDFNEWTCTGCKRDISSLLDGYSAEDSSNEIVGVLQNDFCPNPDLDLGSKDKIEECKKFMPVFIPGAMEQISQLVSDHSPVLCHNLFDVPCEF